MDKKQLEDSYNHCLNVNNELEMELLHLRLEARDQFAMAALQGLLASKGKSVYGFDVTAEQAYICADAMLKARG